MAYSATLAAKGTYYSDYVGEEMVDLLDKTFQIPKGYNVTLGLIEPEYEARPDLVAAEIYGVDSYASELFKLNGPSNPFEVNAGQYILVPSMDAISEFDVFPSPLWKKDAYATKPKPKAKTEKRKPNEAVVGDKRFNVDKLSKIIIY